MSIISRWDKFGVYMAHKSAGNGVMFLIPIFMNTNAHELLQ